MGIAVAVLALSAGAFFAFHPKREPLTRRNWTPVSPRTGRVPRPNRRPLPATGVLARATTDVPFVNSLGMKFVPVPIVSGPTAGQKVLFGIWDVRAVDYAAYAVGNPEANGLWKTQKKDGVPCGRELDHPVVGVSWDDAQAFCQWLTQKEQAEGKLPKGVKYRLPSDEEWSWAVGLPAELGSTPAEKNGRNSVDFPWGRTTRRRGKWETTPMRPSTRSSR